MVRLGMMAAVLATAALLGSNAEACERHAAAARAAANAPTAAAQAPSPAAASEARTSVQALPLDARAHEALVQAGQKLLAAKCDCESKADCTCKKGQCKCSKCRGRHDVVESLQEQGTPQAVDAPAGSARNDATAGVLL